MNPFHFNAAQAGEPLIFGACRPGYAGDQVEREEVKQWMDFMRAEKIVKVICLLNEDQLAYYDDLLGDYRAVFGDANVLSAPIADYQLPSRELLHKSVLPFVHAAVQAGEKTVVHCSAGVGRTGVVLSACLVALRGLSPEQAIQAVRATRRDACEAGDPRDLLESCRKWISE